MPKIKTSKFTFNCRIKGNPSHPLIVLLHGFPESSIMYEELMDDLSVMQFYCIAPDLRGYSPEARPKGKNHYSLEYLVQDVLEIVGQTDHEQFHLIGHDWGSAIGWKLVHDHPDKILTWTALSVPHLQSFFHAVHHDKIQKKKSVYIRLFQWPWLPEWRIRFNDYIILRKLWRDQSETEISEYLGIIKQKGALTSILNYYRGNFELIKKASNSQVLGNINPPTLFIWGNKDLAVGRKAAEGTHDFIVGPYTFIEIDAGHWLIQEKYEAIQSEIIKFLKDHSLMNNS